MNNCYDEAFLAAAIAGKLHQELSPEDLKCFCSFLRLLLNNVEYYVFRKK